MKKKNKKIFFKKKCENGETLQKAHKIGILFLHFCLKNWRKTAEKMEKNGE